MAFVKMENKSDEIEFIVFPSVFAECGAKLEVDNVVRVQGKVNATDKDGNITSDVKLLAEKIELVSDDVLENYQPTGTKLAMPGLAPTNPRRGRTSASKVRNSGGDAMQALSSTPTIDVPRVLKTPPKDPRKERLYILIEDINNTDTLTAIRRLADLNPGFQDVVLVLRDGERKRPLRMPFKVEANEDLLAKLRELVGEEKVKIN